MRHLVASRNQAQSSNSVNYFEAKRGPSNQSSNVISNSNEPVSFGAGKQVLLAAIVHPFSSESSNQSQDDCENGMRVVDSKRIALESNSCNQIAKVKGGGGGKKDCDESDNNNTHIRDSGERNGIKSKLSKLFTRNSNKQTSNQLQQTLIDNLAKNKEKNNEYLENQRIANDIGGSGRLSKKASREKHLFATNGSEEQQVDGANGAGEVIEFKFDLIVERDREEQLFERKLKTSLSQQQLQSNQYVKSKANSNSTISKNSQQLGKLEEKVNELIESFVLDSNDVCLMSTGKEQFQCDWFDSDTHLDLKTSSQRIQPTQKPSQTFCQVSNGEFDFICKLAAHSLAYSFELFDSIKDDNHSSKANNVKTFKKTSSSDELDFDNSSSEPNSVGNHENNPDYSIELSATLFLSRRRPTLPSDLLLPPTNIQPPTQNQHLSEMNQYQILDLLSDDDNSLDKTANSCSNKTTLSCDDSKQQVNGNRLQLDCRTLEQALAGLERISRKLISIESVIDRYKASSKLLLVGLKLKQRINGGLFSNRLSLIDFDPKFVQLNQLFESIFNGQALAYLRKRHKLINEQEFNINHKDELIDDLNNSSNVSSNKQHHQVASERKKLYQTEWSLYKQLSSALIRTLLIVHVHKQHSIQGENQLQNTNQPYYERFLMEQNLTLLEFAKTIQRASNVRLKRRKRHLKSHLAASSNVSVASNASANTTIQYNRQYQDHYNQSMMIFKTSSYSRKRASRLDHLQEFRKSSLANQNVNQRTCGYHRRHKSSSNYKPSSKYCMPRQSFDYLTESSSMSTSTSGSGGNQTDATRQLQSQNSSSQARRNQQRQITRRGSDQQQQLLLLQQHQHQFEETNLNSCNFYSDTDSITSVNFNSCSSSSFNKLATSSSQSPSTMQILQNNNNNNTSNKSKQRRDVELKWLSKQKNNSSHYPSHNNNSRPPSGHNVTTSKKHYHDNTSIELSHLNQSQGEAANRKLDLTLVNRRESSSSSIIQIDCQNPLDLANGTNMGLVVDGRGGDEAEEGEVDLACIKSETGQVVDQLDNISDTCSVVVVAEPPKQLKLEEFLSQFSNVIATPCPQVIKRDLNNLACERNKIGDERNAEKQPDKQAFVTLNVADDDEDDCKSHSSILEHLSSLAFETSNKLLIGNTRQAQAQIETLTQIDDHYTILPSPGQVTSIEESTPVPSKSKIPITGQLQQILNCSSKLLHRQTTDARVSVVKDEVQRKSSLEDQLRALSISCQPSSNQDKQNVSSPSTSSGAFASLSASDSNSLSPATGDGTVVKQMVASNMF